MGTSAKPSVLYALTRALRAVQCGPEAAPTVALAKRYAAMIDEDPTRLARLGRPFLAVLVELQLTPRARRGVMAGDFLDESEPGDVTPNREGATGDGDERGDERDELDELRSRRDRREHGASTVDASS